MRLASDAADGDREAELEHFENLTIAGETVPGKAGVAALDKKFKDDDTLIEFDFRRAKP